MVGFFAFPDTPQTTKAWWLTPEEKRLCVERLPEVQKKRGELGWSIVTRVMKTWHFVAFILLWIFASNTEMWSTNAIMNIWMSQTGRYATEQVNYVPTGVAGVGILATLLMGWYSDFVQKPWHVGIFLSCTAVLSGGLMIKPPSTEAKFFALFLNGAQYASQTVMFAWANKLTRNDDAKRGILLAAMNTFGIAVYMFWSLIFYSTTQGPDWFEGSIAMICMGTALCFCTLSAHYMEKRDEKRVAAEVIVQEGDAGSSLKGDDIGRKEAEAGTQSHPV